jgi:hypothetical protein
MYVLKGVLKGTVVYYSKNKRHTTDIYKAIIFGPRDYSGTGEAYMNNLCDTSTIQIVEIKEI